MKPEVIIVLGPTATGKSALGVCLAKRLHGEIISGDSMLVYRGMDIGTAKPKPEKMDNVPHYLIDILDPKEAYNVADFQQQADRAIRKVQAKGKMPILVGGTGLYLQALLEYALRKHITPASPASRWRSGSIRLRPSSPPRPAASRR